MFPDPLVLLDVVSVLGEHPDKRRSSNDTWGQEGSSDLCGAENKELGHEMEPGDTEGAEDNVVHGSEVEVVGAVETDNSADKGPDTEGASRETSDFMGLVGVDTASGSEGGESLEGVEERGDTDDPEPLGQESSRES